MTHDPANGLSLLSDGDGGCIGIAAGYRDGSLNDEKLLNVGRLVCKGGPFGDLLSLGDGSVEGEPKGSFVSKVDFVGSANDDSDGAIDGTLIVALVGYFPNAVGAIDCSVVGATTRFSEDGETLSFVDGATLTKGAALFRFAEADIDGLVVANEPLPSDDGMAVGNTFPC